MSRPTPPPPASPESSESSPPREIRLSAALAEWRAGRLTLADAFVLRGAPNEAEQVLDALDADLTSLPFAPLTDGGPDPAIGWTLRAGAALARGQLADAHADVERALAAGAPMPLLDRALDRLLDQAGKRALGGPMRTVAWLVTAGAQTRSVVRIESRGGVFCGTGVVVLGRALHPSLDDRPLVLTCAHVCCDDPGPLPDGWSTPLDPAEAELVLPGGASPPASESDAELPVRIAVEGVLWRSRVGELDACALAPAGPLPAWATPIEPSAAEVFAGATRTYLFGYPGGGPLMFSGEESLVDAVGWGRFSHGLGAEPGSSGGPVFHFDDSGLVGLHRGEQDGVGQATLLSAIRIAIARDRRASSHSPRPGVIEDGVNMAAIKALLIGIDAYDTRPLAGCVNDALAVSAYLSEKLGVPESDQVRLLAPAGATPDATWPTRRAIVGALEALADAGPEAAVFVYFSGHGARDVRGMLACEALAPIDFDRAGLLYDYDFNRLLVGIARRVGSLSVVLDCCHSAGAKRLGDGAPTGRVRTLPPEAIEAAPAPPAPSDRGMGGGLGGEAAAFVVAAACQANELASEVWLDGQDRGAFTAAWLDAVAHSVRPADALTWTEVWPALRARLAKLSRSQVPQVLGDAGRAIFTGAPGHQPGLAIERKGARHAIAGGVLTGVDVGAVIAVFGPEVVALPAPGVEAPEDAIGLIEVLEAHPFDAIGRAVVFDRGGGCLPAPPFDVPPGARGRVLRPGPGDALTVYLDPRDAALEAALERAGIRVVGAADDPRIECTVERVDGDRFVVRDAVYAEGPDADPKRDPAAVGPWWWGARDDLVEVLGHYALYRRPLRLAERGQPEAPALTVRVLDCADEAAVAATDPHGPTLPEVGGDPTGRFAVAVEEDQPVCVTVTNVGRNGLYVTLIDCGAGGDVTVLGTGLYLDRRQTDTFWLEGNLRAPFYASLPEHRRRNGWGGVERLVVIGTDRPDVAFDELTLPELEEVIEPHRGDKALAGLGRRRLETQPWTVALVPLLVYASGSAAAGCKRASGKA